MFITPHQKRNLLLGILFLGALVATGAISANIGGFVKERNILAHGSQLRVSSTGFDYVRPLLACDTLKDFESISYSGLKEQFRTYTDSELSKKNVTDVSVYFRDLSNGQWTAINPDEYFHPASLLKVANLISVMKEEDAGRNILKKTFTVDPKTVPAVEQSIPPTHTLQDFETYTVNDLLRYLITYSDNRVNKALNTIADLNMLATVYADFGVETKDTDGSFMVTPRAYALFFRALYNGTYLSKQLSERSLELLGDTDYNNGLVAGVPQGTLIAHKFGNDVRKDADGAVIQELHDCGVIYRKDGDYVLCVMTKGTDVQKMESVISTISSIAYNFSLNPKQ